MRSVIESSDPYLILGISHRATRAEIKAARKQALLRWHPDKNPDNTREAAKNTAKINAAYEWMLENHSSPAPSAPKKCPASEAENTVPAPSAPKKCSTSEAKNTASSVSSLPGWIWMALHCIMCLGFFLPMAFLSLTFCISWCKAVILECDLNIVPVVIEVCIGLFAGSVYAAIGLGELCATYVESRLKAGIRDIATVFVLGVLSACMAALMLPMVMVAVVGKVAIALIATLSVFSVTCCLGAVVCGGAQLVDWYKSCRSASSDAATDSQFKQNDSSYKKMFAEEKLGKATATKEDPGLSSDQQAEALPSAKWSKCWTWVFHRASSAPSSTRAFDSGAGVYQLD